MPTDPVRDLAPGLAVFTLDGEKIGSVKEVTADAFKVDAPLRPDYWLPRDRVLSFTNERVTLDFNESDLDRHRAAEPGAS
jgi:hypothetical protein